MVCPFCASLLSYSYRETRTSNSSTTVADLGTLHCLDSSYSSNQHSSRHSLMENEMSQRKIDLGQEQAVHLYPLVTWLYFTPWHLHFTLRARGL